ncbi:MAG: hypothetical protein B6242_15345 [Anaerolineaceae bacterium 4572_78]|nr:MAG: hypothetical protein B6242_15345 [Anaerolineaceae bacterium 4572_78]
MKTSILSKREQDILDRERKWLYDLHVQLDNIGTAKSDLETLTAVTKQLDQPFMLIVAGEFNAGKSTFINALLGHEILKMGVTPTTTQVTILQHGDDSKRHVEEEHLHILKEPIDLLRQLNIVDTPGTNAITPEHQLITERFLPRFDLVLFITSADNPLTYSERQFLENIRNWGKQIVFILNKIDYLRSEDDVQELLTFVKDNLIQYGIGDKPDIFPVSAWQTLRHKLDGTPTSPNNDFESLEKFIYTILEKHALRLKLLNPLGVSNRLLDTCLHQTQQDLAHVQSKANVLFELAEMLNQNIMEFDTWLTDAEHLFDKVDEHISLFMIRGVVLRKVFRSKIVVNLPPGIRDAVLAFLDQILGVGEVDIQHDFKETVIADLPQKFEERIQKLSERFIAADVSQWQQVKHALEPYRHDHIFLEAVLIAAKQVLMTYNQAAEVDRIVATITMTMAQQGTVSQDKLSKVISNWGELVTLHAIAILNSYGLWQLILSPSRFQTAQKEVEYCLWQWRNTIMDVLRNIFQAEVEWRQHTLHDLIQPHVNRMNDQIETLQQQESELNQTKDELKLLRLAVRAIS